LIFLFQYLIHSGIYAKHSARSIGKENLTGLGLAITKILPYKKMDAARLLFIQEMANKK